MSESTPTECRGCDTPSACHLWRTCLARAVADWQQAQTYPNNAAQPKPIRWPWRAPHPHEEPHEPMHRIHPETA